MKNYKLLLILWAGLSSCGIYRQNVVNVPMVQQKGQLQMGVYESFSGKEAQASYAVTNNIALMANYNNMGAKRTDFTKDVNYIIDRHYFGEIGLGLYKKDTTRKSGKIREIFLIAGNGMTSHFYQGLDSLKNIGTSLRQASYSRFCLQADIGKTSDDFSLLFSPRLLFVHYYGVSDPDRDDYKSLLGSYIYFETALTARYTIKKYITLTGQACVTMGITDYGERKYNYYYDFAPFNFSVGMLVNLKLFK